MAQTNRKGEENMYSHHHLALPEVETQDRGTIYKLRLSMKKRLSPKEAETPSPQGAAELRNLMQRLVEIDNESRKLLLQVFAMLEKDEKLENYMKKRIEDPKVSRMWQLVEQLLACGQEDNINLDELMLSDDSSSSYSSDYSIGTRIKGIKQKNEEETTIDRFKIRTLDPGGGANGVEKSTAAASK